MKKNWEKVEWNIMAYFNVPFCHTLKGAEENHEILSQDSQSEIWARHLRSTRKKHYCPSQRAQYWVHNKDSVTSAWVTTRPWSCVLHYKQWDSERWWWVPQFHHQNISLHNIYNSSFIVIPLFNSVYTIQLIKRLEPSPQFHSGTVGSWPFHSRHVQAWFFSLR
jgi:hypothetical protein